MRKRRRIAIVPVTLTVMLFLTFILSLIHSFKDNNHTLTPVEVSEINEIKYENITDNNGHYHYEDSHYTSSFGIDVSEFQEDIDWKKVKEDGVEFAYIRLGRRGAATGLLYADDSFEDNYEGIKANNIKVGVYFFSQAINTKEAQEEAHFLMNMIKHKQIDLPIVYDMEDVYLPEETARTEGLSKEVYTENAIAFCEELKKYGYEPMIYTNQYWSQFLYDMDKLSEYPIWFAMYDADAPNTQYPVSIWQYTNKGKIDGCRYDVDFNIMFIRK